MPFPHSLTHPLTFLAASDSGNAAAMQTAAPGLIGAAAIMLLAL